MDVLIRMDHYLAVEPRNGDHDASLRSGVAQAFPEVNPFFVADVASIGGTPGSSARPCLARSEMKMENRYIGMDVARSSLMLLGIVFHAGLIYSVNGEWRLAYHDQHYIFNIVTQAIHLFRMEAFYIVSGFFFLMLLEKKGIWMTLVDRAFRLGIPLITIGFSLNSVMNSVSDNREFEFSLRYILRGQWLGPLWFLGNLLAYCAMFALPAKMLCAKKMKPASSVNLAFVALVLTPLLSAILYVLGRKLYGGTIVFISFSALYKYLPYFVLGGYCWRHKEVFLAMMNWRTGCLLVGAFLALDIAGDSIKAAESAPGFLIESAENACLALASLSFFNGLSGKRNGFIVALVDSSYTFYLLHQPVIVFLFLSFVGKLDIGAFPSFFLLSLSCFLCCHVIYYRVVRKSDLLLLLINGKIPIRVMTFIKGIRMPSTHVA